MVHLNVEFFSIPHRLKTTTPTTTKLSTLYVALLLMPRAGLRTFAGAKCIVNSATTDKKASSSSVLAIEQILSLGRCPLELFVLSCNISLHFPNSKAKIDYISHSQQQRHSPHHDLRIRLPTGSSIRVGFVCLFVCLFVAFHSSIYLHI